MKTIATILGARPQFVKLAPVARALTASGRARQVLIHTGQHFDAGMSDVFFEELGLPAPDHHLGIHGGGHGAMTGAMLERLEPLLEALRPDWVVVYGDTNSTLAGALAAAKLHIPIAHVEAGLRAFNRAMPEEVNRVLTDHLSDLLFAPTKAAVRNLAREGFEPARIFEVGDVMYDAALDIATRPGAEDRVRAAGVEPGRYVLASVHRAGNTDDPARLGAIVTALERVAETLPVLLPLHPRTEARLASAGLGFRRVRTVPPLGYLDMAALESRAAVIATDSGGVQKEAFFHEVPCVTLREETEWVELVELGWNRLAPPDSPGMAEAILAAIGTRGAGAKPYGEGRAAEAIARILLNGRQTA